MRANETYSQAKRQISDRTRAVLVNVQSLISGGTLLSLRCSARVSSLPPFVSEGVGLVRVYW